MNVGFDPTMGLDDTRVATIARSTDGRTEQGARLSETMLPAGRHVASRYALISIIGRGGFGEVWRARDAILGEDVAVKLQPLSDTRQDWSRREVATLGLLRLPGICHLRDDGVEDGLRFVVMDLVDGRPFPGFEVAGDVTTHAWAWNAVAPAALSLLDALGRVHAYGVVHRDLKPENVLVDEDGHATLLDFGVAFNPDLESHTDRRMAGTPRYLAPEQIRGRGSDPRSDLYAVGVMLFNALSGRWPHDATDRDTLFRRKLSQPATPLRTVAPDVPAVVAEAVDRLLQFRAGDRPSSVAELVAALEGTHYVDPIESLTAVEVIGDVAGPNELRVLFAGHDRLTRVPSHAAAELHRRTHGDPERIRTELRAWVRARLARIEDGRVVVERAELDRLQAGLRVAPRPRVEESVAWPDGAMVTALALADGQLEPTEIAAAVGLPVREVEQTGAELVQRGLAEPFGRTVRMHHPERVTRRDDVGRVCAALVAALPAADLRRVRIAVAAGGDGRAREVALDVARAAHESVDTLTARAAARVGVDLCPRGDDSETARALRTSLCLAWCRVDSTTSRETSLYLAQSERGAQDPVWDRIEPVIRASVVASRRGGEQALDALGWPEPTGVDAWDALRISMGINIANRLPLHRSGEVLRRLECDADGPSLRYARAMWKAREAYRHGDFARAAAVYEDLATTGSRSVGSSAVGLTNASSAALEAENFAEARRISAQARALIEVAPRWNTLLAGRIEWLDRSIDYRTRRWAGGADRELVEAALSARLGMVGCLLLFTEASMAARAGDVTYAGDVFEEICDRTSGLNLQLPLTVSLCAAAMMGRDVNLQPALDAIESRALPPLVEAQGIRCLQALGLYGADATRRVDDLCERAGAKDGSVRELLTIAECRGAPLPWG